MEVISKEVMAEGPIIMDAPTIPKARPMTVVLVSFSSSVRKWASRAVTSGTVGVRIPTSELSK